LLFFVREPAVPAPVRRSRKPDPSATSAVGKPLLAFLGVLLLFNLGNSADAFLLLRLSDALGSATYVPLLWSALHVVKVSLSTWGGELSDRLGRRHVSSSAGCCTPSFTWICSGERRVDTRRMVPGICAFSELTEGDEKALVADLVPADKHGVAFGLYNTTRCWDTGRKCRVRPVARTIRCTGCVFNRCGAGHARSGAVDGTPALVPGW
jgi:hypothetical protein